MNALTLIRGLALLIIFGGFGISGYFRSRADSQDKKVDFSAEHLWQRRLRVSGALAFYLGMLAWLIYPPSMSWSDLDWPMNLRWLGLGLTATMLPFLYWMFSSLGSNITPTVKTRQNHKFITHGPYRYIRHPLYTFGTMFFGGIIMVTGNWFIMAGAMLGLSALFSRTPQEEERLIEHFGDEYKTYMRTTGRYFPKLKI
jgi:protein-S-isoprenylcysteine O-methyltransferase Ste14